MATETKNDNPLRITVDADTVVSAIYAQVPAIDYRGECRFDSQCPNGQTCILEGPFFDNANANDLIDPVEYYTGTCKRPDDPPQWRFILQYDSSPSEGGTVNFTANPTGRVVEQSGPTLITAPNGQQYFQKIWDIEQDNDLSVNFTASPASGFVFDKWIIFDDGLSGTTEINGNPDNVPISIKKSTTTFVRAVFKEDTVTSTQFKLTLRTGDVNAGSVEAILQNNISGIVINNRRLRNDVDIEYTITSPNGTVTEYPVRIVATSNTGYNFNIWNDNTGDSREDREEDSRNLILKPNTPIEATATFTRIEPPTVTVKCLDANGNCVDTLVVGNISEGVEALCRKENRVPCPDLCEDQTANNVGQPLPCTYDAVCEDPSANNTGQPLPCTYDEEEEKWRRCSDRSLNSFPVESGLREVPDPLNDGGTCWEPTNTISLGLGDINFTYRRGDTLPEPKTFTAENTSEGVAYNVELKTNTNYFIIEPSAFTLSPQSTVNYSIRLTENINPNSDGITPMADGTTEWDLNVTVTEA